MTIFFSSIPSSKLSSSDTHQHILIILQKEHFVIDNSSKDPNDFDQYRETISSIKQADLCIVEVSNFSQAIWYQISIALEYKKQVIALYNDDADTDALKAIVATNNQDHLFFINYTTDNLENQLLDALYYSKKNLVQRFTLLLPYHLVNYLEEVNRKTNSSKSYFIRSLIEKHMKDHS